MDTSYAEIDRLVEKGRQLLSAGNYREADKNFAVALEKVESVPIRNNLALAVFESGEAERALEILEPYLDAAGGAGEANPFTHALASRIYSSLNRREEARRQLELAVRSFDDGLVALRRAGRAGKEETFLEYTVAVMRAASALQDHRLVFELYRRWESYHVSWENKHLAAVACFNLGRYKRAASLWSAIAGVHSLFPVMQQVAFMVEKGVIPPFEMDYQLPTEKQVEQLLGAAGADKEARQCLARQGVFRMMLLGSLMDGEDNNKMAGMALRTLIYYGGEWGEKLGRRVLEHPGFASGHKVAAARALMDRGVLPEDRPVTMFIDGEMRQVEIKENKVVVEPDAKLDAIVEKALQLRDDGREDRAGALLEDLYQQGTFYPPAMMLLADIWHRRGRSREALLMLEPLAEIAPEDPAVLYSLALLALHTGDYEKARAYLGRIDVQELDEELRQQVKELETSLQVGITLENMLQDKSYLISLFSEDRRSEVEEKTLSRNPSLARGLKNMPAIWLEGACRLYGIQPARLRRDREKQLVEFLSRPANLARVVRELGKEEQDLLAYLLQREGWSRINAVSRKFGSLEGDGYFWNEPGHEPESPLGVLWLRALVMVGRATISGRRCKIATIPVELRQPLAEILRKRGQATF